MLNKLHNFLSTMFAPDSLVVSRPESALQLAVAVLLIEVMQSDAYCAEEEQAAIRKILKEQFQLSDAEVTQLSEQGLQAAKNANDFHRFTSLINQEFELAEKIHLTEYLWEVAYADGVLSAHENHFMHKIVDLLHISLGDNIAAKMRAQRACLK